MRPLALPDERHQADEVRITHCAVRRIIASVA
jgi:hypothetical protein